MTYIILMLLLLIVHTFMYLFLYTLNILCNWHGKLNTYDI